MKTFLTLILPAFFFAALPAGEITIEPDKAVISAPKTNDPAAQELKTHLELITGKTIPILGGGQVKRNAYIFHIGKVPVGVPVKFQPEEARWQVTPQAAYFYGEGRKGSLNAVYDFLENELGIRWPGGTDIAFRKQNPVRVKNMEGKWIPELNMRGIRGGIDRDCDRKAETLWRRRLRVGGHNAPQYGHAFTRYWRRFGKTHPEFFAMRPDGVRGPVNLRKGGDNAAAFQGDSGGAVALCVSNDTLADQIIADWKKRRCPLYINLCENDALGKDSCHCPKCTALDVVPKKKTPWENWYADRYIHFANRVLAKAKKIRPDVKAAMYAYNAMEQPPSREKPHPDLVIGIVPTDFTMTGTEKFVGSWKKAGLNHFFYRPNLYTYYLLPQLPVGYEKHFFEIWQYLYRSGAIGFDYDGAGGEKSFLVCFGKYLLLKAMQDPSKPFEYWEKHYMQAFGNAADDVTKYYRYWREQVWEKRLAPHQAEIAERGKWFNFARGLCWDMGKYYKESDFTEAGKYLETALSRELTAEERARIEKLKFANEHARLFFNAAVRKTDADALKLLAFREKHKLPLLPDNEKRYGDICGIQRVMNFREYRPPYLKMPLFWHFKLDPENKGIAEKWYENTPAQVARWGAWMCTNTPWESPHKHYKQVSAAIRAKTAQYDGIAWYGTQVKIPEDWKGRKVFLYFGAVDESCWVYLNGKKAGERIFKKSNDWSTPFTIEITSIIDWKLKQQDVIVRVEDKGGQGGIWKPVWVLSKQ